MSNLNYQSNYLGNPRTQVGVEDRCKGAPSGGGLGKDEYGTEFVGHAECELSEEKFALFFLNCHCGSVLRAVCEFSASSAFISVSFVA